MTPLIALLALATSQGDAPNHRGCRVGLTLNVSVNGGVPELLANAKEARRLGCDISAMSVKWSDLEPTAGALKVDRLNWDLRNTVNTGFVPMLTLQTIDTNNRTLPADLKSEAWDSPKMLAREVAFLKAVGAVLPKEIGAVMLGNEVDGYLPSHPSEIKPYLEFLRAGRETLKAADPGVQVGVTTMFNSLANDTGLISLIQKNMDLVSMTYYPLGSNFAVLPVDDVGKHIAKMVAFAGSRKLFIQEAGFPASPLLGSSDEKQVKFVDALFDAMVKHRDRLIGVCYFLLVDLNDKLVDSLVGYYGLQSDTFRAYLSTLGLKKQDGAPRPSWEEFKKRATGY
ncbi:MAG: hypothetical protein P4L46_16650 [Fimbriimonas sp.]|nr:hypothetical protein [Fimbriimonas sp.]